MAESYWDRSVFNPKNWVSKDESGTAEYSGSLKDDVTMGAISFGVGFDKAADKLADAGYTPEQIKDFQDRTKETMKNEPAFPDDDNGPTRTVTEEPETDVTEDVAETDGVSDITAQIQDVADIATGGRGGSTGPAEDEARAFAEKGRKSTVLTSMQGLEELSAEDIQKLRSRRSLLAG